MNPSNPAKKDGAIWTYEDARTRIVINRKWCKGCEVCVEFCPQKTLLMQGDKPVVGDLATCTRCMLCEMRCPDFAVEVFDPAKPQAPKPGGREG
jgi:2-oxoglutarate ferredoxin oxidoreductase subunit delta